MKNIELKIFIKNYKEIISLLKKLKAKFKNNLKQRDTYYNCEKGRLKIRETMNDQPYLIYYLRSDKLNSKTSDSQLIKLNNKQFKILKLILKSILGEKIIVDKERELWLYQNTIIHLDKVKHLGSFLELETFVKENYRKARLEHEKIKNLLNLSKYKKYNKSYADLLLSKKL